MPKSCRVKVVCKFAIFFYVGIWYNFPARVKSLTILQRSIIIMPRKKQKKEKISKKAIQHSSLGEFTQGDRKHQPRLRSGGHGEENIQELNKRGMEYNITKQYPNGVRVGNVPTHKDKQKRELNKQSWFPKNWTRDIIKKAGEKTISEEKAKRKDGEISIGTYKKVKVGVIRTKGKVTTIFPLNKQSGGKRK